MTEILQVSLSEQTTRAHKWLGSLGSLKGRGILKVASCGATWCHSHQEHQSFKAWYAAREGHAVQNWLCSSSAVNEYNIFLCSHNTHECKVNSHISLCHCETSLQLTVLLIMIKIQWSKKCGWPQTSCQIINLIITQIFVMGWKINYTSPWKWKKLREHPKNYLLLQPRPEFCMKQICPHTVESKYC